MSEKKANRVVVAEAAALGLVNFARSNGIDHSFRTEGPSLTRQEFLEESDINSLMKRYEGYAHGGPGGLPVRAGEMFYADFTQMPTTLLEYMTFMQDAETAFMSLPATVRREFDNSAAAFVDFASDPENIGQMRTWGLAPPEEAPPKPQEVRIVADDRPAQPPQNSFSGAGAAGSTHGST